MSETPGTYYTGNSMSDTPDTEELKCLSLIEVMAIPQERREIALGTLRAIKERDELKVAWYEMQSSFERSRDEVEKLIRERDEARATLMRIEELFIDGTNVYADREAMGLIARDALEKIYEH